MVTAAIALFNKLLEIEAQADINPAIERIADAQVDVLLARPTQAPEPYAGGTIVARVDVHPPPVEAGLLK